MNIAPQTTFNDLTDQLNALRVSARHVEKSSFAWMRLKRECDKLCQADPLFGWSALGILYTICGDVAELERCFQNSARIGFSETVVLNRLASYGTLLLATYALELYVATGGAGKLPIAATYNAVFCSGGFQIVAKNFEDAIRMGMSMDGLPVDIVQRSASILAKANLSDQELARHIDLAGEVMRERKLFDVNAPTVFANEDGTDAPGVTIVFYIPCEPKDVFAFNVALAEKEDAAQIAKHPAFDVVFSAAVAYDDA